MDYRPFGLLDMTPGFPAGGVAGRTPSGADDLGRLLYSMTGAGGAQDAAGLLGGPSVRENLRSGNNFDAGLQMLAALPVVGMLGTAGKSAKIGRMASNGDISKEITDYLHSLLAERPDAFHGLRVTPSPLSEGAKAPPSKQWYNDFISDDHEVFGREAFPDHGHELPGPSVIGIKNAKDINLALKLLGLNNEIGGYGHLGDNISVISGGERIFGNDAHEWILPESVVLKTWVKNSEK